MEDKILQEDLDFIFKMLNLICDESKWDYEEKFDYVMSILLELSTYDSHLIISDLEITCDDEEIDLRDFFEEHRQNKIKTKQKEIDNEKERVKNIEIKLDKFIGYNEIKDNIEFTLKLFKESEKCKLFDINQPKGFILYGEPGTGKTTIARNISKCLGGNFFQANGSDFVEKYVGIGPQRIRNLFQEAREKTPSVIFIDEIDAIGKNRNDELNGEMQNTLNALLAELDGLKSNDDVFVICATNRIDILDSALLRQGRFDEKIEVPLPNFEGRTQLIKFFSEKKPIQNGFDVTELAKITKSFSGSDIEGLFKKASIMALKNNQEEIKLSDIDKAFKIIKNSKPSEKRKAGFAV